MTIRYFRYSIRVLALMRYFKLPLKLFVTHMETRCMAQFFRSARRSLFLHVEVEDWYRFAPVSACHLHMSWCILCQVPKVCSLHQLLCKN